MPKWAKFTEQVYTSITPEMRRQLEDEARRKHRSLSGMVRVLLMEALNPPVPVQDRHNYEIVCSPKQARKLTTLGYKLKPEQYEQLPLPEPDPVV